MTWQQLLLIALATVVLALLIRKRRPSVWLHRPSIVLFHFSLALSCAAAGDRAWHADPGYGYSFIGVAVAALWLYISRHSWADGCIPEHFCLKQPI